MVRSTPFVLDEISIATSTPLFRKASPTSRIFKKVTRIALVQTIYCVTFTFIFIFNSVGFMSFSSSMKCLRKYQMSFFFEKKKAPSFWNLYIF